LLGETEAHSKTGLKGRASDDLYSSLRWTAEDRRKIKEIITCMGQHGLGEIGFIYFISYAPTFRKYEREMESTKVESEPLHPLKFLETVFAEPTLAKYMPALFDNFYLRVGFMAGVNKGMNREMDRNNVEPFIEPFCLRTGASADEIRPLIQAREWEKFVRCLIEATASRGEQISLE
jgi:hypothetical protein